MFDQIILPDSTNDSYEKCIKKVNNNGTQNSVPINFQTFYTGTGTCFTKVVIKVELS